MLRAPIRSFLLQRTQAVVFPSQAFTMKQSLLAHLVLAAATTKTTALCKPPIQFSLMSDFFKYGSSQFWCWLWLCRSNSKAAHRTGINTPKKDNTPLLQCTHHMCPIRVHWHVKVNYKEYWRVKIAITNFNYRMNYTQWTLVAQHPNLNNVTQVFSFDYKPLVPYESIS